MKARRVILHQIVSPSFILPKLLPRPTLPSPGPPVPLFRRPHTLSSSTPTGLK